MYSKPFYIVSSGVEVNFDADRYIVDENDGQVNVSLCIDGKFFFPVWAIVEVSNGTATGMYNIRMWNA